MAQQSGKFAELEFRQFKNLAVVELVEIEEGQRRSLRLRRRRDPDGKLIYIQALDLCRSGRRKLMLFESSNLRLQALLGRLYAAPARIAKEVERIGRSFAIGTKQRRRAQCRLANLLGFT